MGTVRKDCGNSAEIPREQCGKIAEMLRKRCRKTTGVVRTYCGHNAEHGRSRCGRDVEVHSWATIANTYVRCANVHVRSANAGFGVQTPGSVCGRCIRYANIYVQMQTLKNHFFSYQISQLFIPLQGNKVLIDLGGRFHGSIAACSNNRRPPSLGWL